jgi:hypothetical protein
VVLHTLCLKRKNNNKFLKMKIITANPILQMSSLGYSNITGTDNTEAIKQFQIFANKKDANLKLTENGVWNQATADASVKYGADFDKFAKLMLGITLTTTGVLPMATNQNTTSETTKTTLITEDKDKKDEGMSTGMKIGLAVGGVAVIGAIIYFATRKK